MSSNVDKSQERQKFILDEFEKGRVNKTDLNKETKKAVELKIYAEEERVKYEAWTNRKYLSYFGIGFILILDFKSWNNLYY